MSPKFARIQQTSGLSLAHFGFQRVFQPVFQPVFQLGLVTCLTAAVLLASPMAWADDPSPLAASFYGQVTVDGSPVPAGTPVDAYVDGVLWAQGFARASGVGTSFVLHVPADVPGTAEVEGATEGATVSFRVGGGSAPETALWSSGQHVRVDVSGVVGADLAVSLDDGAERVARGDSVTYTLSVDNQGGVDASGIELRQTIPDFAHIDSTDGGTQVGDGVEWPAFDLPAGDSVTRTVVVTIDPATPAGVSQLSSTATVSDDGASGLDPSLENNSATDTNVLEPPPEELPDLVMAHDNLVIDPASPEAGEDASVTGVVRNIGSGTAIAAPVEIYQGDPENGGILLHSVLLDDMAAGGNQPFAFTWTAEEGVHTITAVVDPAGSMLEVTTDNNRTERTVVVPRAAGPDLQVSLVDASGLGQSALDLRLLGQAQVEITNAGDQPAPAPFLVSLYVDRDGDRRQGPTEPVLASVTVSQDLAAAASTTVSLDVDATTEFLHPLVWAFADAADQVAEQREDNNQVPLFGDCELPQPVPSLQPVEEWWLRDVEIESVPVVVQLSDDNGDGEIDSRDVPDVVFHSTDNEGGGILAVSGLDGSRLWMLRHTSDNKIQGYLAQVAAGDLNADGVAEIIGHRTDGRLVAVDHTGAILWVSDRVEGVGNRGLGAPSLGDLDGDGTPEIAYGRAVLSNTGVLIATGNTNRGQNHNYYGPFGTALPPGFGSFPFSVIADIDLDGRNELVAGDAAYRLQDGELVVVWDRNEPDNLMRDGFAALGNFDSDPYAEIVYLSSNQLTVINHDGSTFVGRRVMIPFSPFQMPTFWGGPPAVADLDGDGVSEILTVGATHISAYRGNLSLLWRKPVKNDFGGVHGITAFDLDGDGTKEVLFADEDNFHIYDRFGNEIYVQPNRTKTANEHPIVVDVDGDGRAEILLPSNTFFNGDASTRGLHVLGNPSWQGAPSIYHQASYHVGGSLLDGTIPAIGRPSWQVSNAFRATRELPPPRLYRPNLTLSVPRIGAASAEGIPITLRVGNGSPEVLPPGARLTLFRGAVGESEPIVDMRLDFGLRPGAWRDVTVFWRGATVSGTAASAALDLPLDGAPAGGAIEECDETDNAVDFVIDQTLLPDLTLLSVDHDADATVGRRIPFTVNLSNIGWADADASTLRLLGSGGTVLAEMAVDPLAAGAEATVVVDWDSRGATVGVNALEMRADAVDVILESDETNNSSALSINLSAPTRADLSAEDLTVTPAAGLEGDDVTFTAAVLNRGVDLNGSFEVAYLVNAAEVGRTSVPGGLAAGASLDVELVLDTLGRSGELIVAAVIDPDNAIEEENESDNRAEAELFLDPSVLSVAIQPDRTLYDPNQDALLSLSLSNVGDAQDADVAVFITETGGDLLADVALETVNIAAGGSNRAYTWNTGTTAPGTYVAVAELRQGGVVRARGVSPLRIDRDLRGSVQLSGRQSPYAPDAVADLTYDAVNQSVNTTLEEASVLLRITDSAATQVFTTSAALPTLLPGEPANGTVSWPIDFAPPGTYTASLELRDIESTVLATDTLELTVEDSGQTGVGLQGEVTPSPDPVAAGQPLATDYTVQNGGNAAMDELVVRVEIRRQSDDSLVDQQTEPRPLAFGASDSGVFAFDTLTLEGGLYAVRLVGVLPQAEVQLDEVGFEVLPGLSVLDAEILEGDTGTAQLQLTARLSQALPSAVQVDFTTVDGTAEAGLDYTLAAGVIDFAAGETDKTVVVEVLGDVLPEADESLLVELSNASGVALGDAQALALIRDDDVCNSPDLTVNGGFESSLDQGWTSTAPWQRRFTAPAALDGFHYAALEGSGAGELQQSVDLTAFGARIDAGQLDLAVEGFLLTLSTGDTAQLTVDYLDAGGALVSSVTSGAVDTAGSWRSYSNITTLPAGVRTARLSLRGDHGAGSTAAIGFDRVILRALGVQTASAQPVSVAEGHSGTVPVTFTVDLGCPVEGPLSVTFDTRSGSAVAGSDFSQSQGSLDFVLGESTGQITIDVLGDSLDEPDEIFFLDLTAAGDLVVLTPAVRAEIIDDDGAVTVSVGDVTVTEGDSGTVSANFPVTLSATSGKTVRLSYESADLEAKEGLDYQAAQGVLEIQPGELGGQIAVPVLGDRLDEPDETFRLLLVDAENAVIGTTPGTATITDDDEVILTVADLQVAENVDGAIAAVTVTSSLPSTQEVGFTYATADGSAIAGEDYQAASAAFTLPPGEVSGTLPITLINDALEEATETLLIDLSAPVGATLAGTQATVTLIDDDGPTASVADSQVIEGDSGTTDLVFTIGLDIASTRTVSVSYATRDGSAVAGVDYTATSGTVTLAPGETSAQVAVTVIGEEELEFDETLFLDLSNPVNTLIANATATGTILDDDTFFLTLEDAQAVESDGVLRLAVTVQPVPDETVTVDWNTIDDDCTSAAEGEDYTGGSGTLTFAAGTDRLEIEIPIIDDALEEGAEDWQVRLSNPQGALIVRDEAQALLLDDERPTSYTLVVTNRDVRGSHPQFGGGSFDHRRVSRTLADDGKPFYTLDNNDRGWYHQWYHTTPGVNFPVTTSITFTGGPGNYVSWNNPYWPVNGRGFGNEGRNNIFFTTEVQGWFEYRGGESLQFGGDDDCWAFINGRMAIDLGGGHGLITRTIRLDDIAASFGLEIGKVYPIAFFHAERFGGGSNFVFNTNIFVQQVLRGTPRFNAGSYQGIEGEDTITATVSRIGGRSGRMDLQVVAVDGTAEQGTDFVVTPATLVFESGDDTPQTIEIQLPDDSLDEIDETTTLRLEPLTCDVELDDGSEAGLTILDEDPPPTITASARPMAEGNNGQTTPLVFELALSHSHPLPVTVQYATADGSALAGEDYQAVTGTVTFNPGELTRNVIVTVFGDNLLEGDEDLSLVLSSPVEGVVGAPSTGFVLDDDDCPSPNIVLNGGNELPLVDGNIPFWTEAQTTAWTQTGRRVEGRFGFYAGRVGTAELRQDIDISGWATRVDAGIQRFRAEGWTFSLNQNNTDSARIVVEYRDADQNVLDVWDTGPTANRFSWVRYSDMRAVPPGARWLRVRLIAVNNNGGNNDGLFDAISVVAMRTPGFSVSDVQVSEGETGLRDANFEVRLSCPADVTTRVDYLTQDHTAIAGEDYQATFGTLTLPAGDTQAVVSVPVIGDTFDEPAEQFYLDLRGSVNAGIAIGRGTGTILPDEVMILTHSIQVTEGQSGLTDAVFTFELTAPSLLPVSVDYETGGGSATGGEGATPDVDYQAAAGTLVFNPGETQVTLVVKVIGDTELEEDETFRVNLSNPVNANLADTRAYADILDDDIGMSIANASLTEGNSGSAELRFAVTLDSMAGQVVSANWTTVDVSATAGEDYVSGSGTVTFQPGDIDQEIIVQVLGDTLLEAGETFEIQLSNPVNSQILQPVATGYIADDDNCPSPNLLRNAGADDSLTLNQIDGWTEVVGGDWRPYDRGRFGEVNGAYHFLAFNPGPVGTVAELRQDVDVTPYASVIDRGAQQFSFEGFMSSFPHSPPQESARMVVEYRDGQGQVLDTYDSGETLFTQGWRRVGDLRLAPVGTRSIRVRLLTPRLNGTNADGYFDALSLRSVGTPALVVEDLEIYEGDDDSVFAQVEVNLTCAAEAPAEVRYQTADVTATRLSDYRPTGGVLVFAPGEVTKTIEVEILGDYKTELLESLTVNFSEADGLVLPDNQMTISIRDADPGNAPVPGTDMEYSFDEDFELGTLVSVDHDPPNGGQLQVSEEGSTFPFIWIALSARDSIAKIHVESGEVLGEYFTRPAGVGRSNPSRTTVALDGTVWVANRDNQSVTHIGLAELNQCIDRNGNGVIETSMGYNDRLAWTNPSGVDSQGGVSSAQDECILHYVKVSTSGTRSIAVTADNNVWVSGTGGGRAFNLIHGTTGQILRTETGFSCGGYGGVIDCRGVVWSNTYNATVLRWDPSVIPATSESRRCIGNGTGPYGLALDSEGALWIASRSGDRVYSVSPDGDTIRGPYRHGNPDAQGMAVDRNDHYWVSSTLVGAGKPHIGHGLPDGTFLGNVEGVCRGSTGVAVDRNGKIWVACEDVSQAARIDPTKGPIGADGVTPVGEVDLIVDLPGSRPYNYSDMTGFQALRAANQGSWTVIQDGGVPETQWGTIAWNQEDQGHVPEGAEIRVEVRSADTVVGLGNQTYLGVENGVSFDLTGRYLQVRATLVRAPTAPGQACTDVAASPVLSDITVSGTNLPTVSIDDVTVVEGDAGEVTQAVFTVTLDEPAVFGAVVDYATLEAEDPATATENTDYVGTFGTLTFEPGETVKTISVPVLGDDDLESDEIFQVWLLRPQNVARGDWQGLGTILDDDARHVLAATKTDALVEDQNGDGQAGVDDVVAYTLTVTNIGNVPVTGVMLDDTLPGVGTVEAGSVTTDVGTVTSESPVQVDIGTLEPAATAGITLRLRLGDLTGLTEIANQASVSSNEAAGVLSDDPDTVEPADPTVTPVVEAGDPELTVSKVDSLVDDADGDGVVSPGDTLEYVIQVANIGNGEATVVVLHDPVPANTNLVAGSVSTSLGSVVSEDPVEVSLGTLDAQATATVTFRALIDRPWPLGVEQVANQATVDSSELPTVLSDDPEVAGEADPTVTPVTAAPSLEADKTDILKVDADGDGVPSPGDTLEYRITVRNTGNTAATAVVFDDATPDHTSYLVGSASVDPVEAGTIESQDPLRVAIDQLAADAQVTITLQVVVDDPMATGVTTVVNQGLVSAEGVDPVATDDPEIAGDADPTVTEIAVTPVLTVEKSDSLLTDVDLDGGVHPGDELLYRIEITASGNTGVSAVTLDDPLGDHLTLVADSVQTDIGTVLSEQPISIDLGTLEPGTVAKVSFRATVDDPFPIDVEQVSNQAIVSSAELDDLLSDDPDTPEPDDPTLTPVAADDTVRCYDEAFDQDLDDSWHSAFIGDADQGAFEVIDGVLRVSGNGSELYHGDDNGHFVYRDVEGDFRTELAFTDVPVDVGGQFRKACLMVRDSVDPLAMRFMACMIPHFPAGNGEVAALQFDHRAAAGEPARELASTHQDVTLPTHVAFTRRGGAITVSFSVDGGMEWIEPLGGIGGTFEGDLPSTLQVGVMVASYDPAQIFSADIDNLSICSPNTDDPKDPGDPGLCETDKRLDVVYLFDLSESMTADFADGSGNKLSAAREALRSVHEQIEVRQDGSRAALLTYAAGNDVDGNLSSSLTIHENLSPNLSAVTQGILDLDSSDVAPLATTPTALGLRGLREQVAPLFDTTGQPVVVWVTDGVPNIDIDGRGPDEYRLNEIQDLSLRDAGGNFLSWGQAAWLGHWNSAIRTFDGETMANSMLELERLKAQVPDLLIYGIAIHGNGVELGTFSDDLVEYAAYISGGQSYQGTDLASLQAAASALLGDLLCDTSPVGAVGDRVWNDIDGDGAQDVGEPGLSQVTLELLDGNGNVAASRTTDSQGDYLFDGLAPGDHTVRVDASTLPGGLDQATFDADGTDTVDSAGVTLDPWQVARQLDFGYRATPAFQEQPPTTVSCPVDDFEDGVLGGDDSPFPWTVTAIGDATLGDAVEAGGRLELSSNGSSMWTDDNIHFMYHPVSGDFRVEVDVVDVPLDPGGNRFRKAGAMIRKDLDIRSPRVMVQYLPDTRDNGPLLQFAFRETADGPSLVLSHTLPRVQLPIRLALEKRGNLYSAWYSLDGGQTWRQRTAGGAGSSVEGRVELDLGDQPLVGLAAASYDNANPLTVAFDDLALCSPADVPAPTAPTAGVCDDLQPMDVAVVLDLSGSMATDYSGGPSRFEAARLAIHDLLDRLGARGDGSRLSLMTYAGHSDLASGPESAVRVLSGLTADLGSVTTVLEGLQTTDIDPTSTTTSPLALQQLEQLLTTGGNPAHRPMVVWLTDGPPNVDLLGRGPYLPELIPADQTPLSFQLSDDSGAYLPWSQVAWQGAFLGDFGRYAGEPTANAMAQLEALRVSAPNVRVFSLALHSDGTVSAPFDEALLEYAAWLTAGDVDGADNTQDLLLAGGRLWDAMTCAATP